MKNLSKILILCLLCGVVYFNALSAGFVLDDKALIVNNPLGKSSALLPNAFRQGLYDHWVISQGYDRMYRPLQTVSYWLDYNLFGPGPFGYHLSNILWHFLNVLLVFYLFTLLFQESKTAFLAAALFAVCPLQSSVVAYISSRADLLAAFFMLSAMILFLKSKYAFSIIAAALALFCRESSSSLFIFIGLILFYRKSNIRAYWPILAYILLDILFILLRYALFGPSGLSTHSEMFGFWPRVLNFLNIIFHYLGLIVFPFNLHFLRVIDFVSTGDVIFILAFTLLIAVTVFYLRKNKNFIFGFGWFLAGLLPAWAFLDGYPLLGKAMMAESWLYLSLAGIFFMLAVFLVGRKKIGKLIFALALIYYSGLTIFNLTFWQNEAALLNRVLKFTGQRNILRKDLIDAYLEKGDYNQALEEINKFSADFGHTGLVDIVWGNYYLAVGRPNAAIARFNRAIVDNRHFFLYYRLSTGYKQKGDLAKAIEFGLASQKANPGFAANLVQLSELYNLNHETALSLEYRQRAQKIDPKNVH